jgi:septal ring-binding cell division protein DamX
VARQTPTPGGEPQRTEAGRDGLVQRRLEATRSWLSAADPEHYSVQILQAEAEAAPRIERLLGEDRVGDRLDQVYVYRTEVKGNPMLSVLYGNYDNFAAASAAVHGLESKLPDCQPYVRTLRKVLAEAKHI